MPTLLGVEKPVIEDLESDAGTIRVEQGVDALIVSCKACGVIVANRDHGGKSPASPTGPVTVPPTGTATRAAAGPAISSGCRAR